MTWKQEFSEVASMVVTWWIVPFCAVYVSTEKPIHETSKQELMLMNYGHEEDAAIHPQHRS